MASADSGDVDEVQVIRGNQAGIHQFHADGLPETSQKVLPGESRRTIG